MNLDGRDLVDAQDLIVIEVDLLDATSLQGDLATKRGGDAEHDALKLRPDGIGIDRNAAIDRADDAADANRSVPRHLDFGNLRHVGCKDELQGHAAAETLRQRQSPAALFGGKLEDSISGATCRADPVAMRRDPASPQPPVPPALCHEDVV